MGTKAISVFCTLALAVQFGCATRAPSDFQFRPSPPVNQSPRVDLKEYKSVEDRSDWQRKDLTVVAAISGGGHRAGNFGVGVLKALDEFQCKGKPRSLLSEVDYFSTVSGGGLAAGAYISTLYDHLDRGGTHWDFSFAEVLNDKNAKDKTAGVKRNRMKRYLERGYHGILARALANIRSIGNLDRGDFLERQFDRMILGAQNRIKAGKAGDGSIRLGSLFIKKGSVEPVSLPIWIANATIYENGGIFPFTPDILREYKVTGYTHNLKVINVSSDDLFSVPLSVGLKASASFPGVVPATTLRTQRDKKNPYLHLFDGGLADNLGINTAMGLLLEDPNPHRVLLVIDAYNGTFEPFSKTKGSPTILQIFFRTTTISLDAWHSRHNWMARTLADSDKSKRARIKIIYLSFEGLPKDDLYKNVRRVSTDFNITREQQESLFHAGKVIVDQKRQELIEGLLLKDCD